jgi:hypothetical protein
MSLLGEGGEEGTIATISMLNVMMNRLSICRAEALALASLTGMCASP